MTQANCPGLEKNPTSPKISCVVEVFNISCRVETFFPNGFPFSCTVHFLESSCEEKSRCLFFLEENHQQQSLMFITSVTLFSELS